MKGIVSVPGSPTVVTGKEMDRRAEGAEILYRKKNMKGSHMITPTAIIRNGMIATIVHRSPTFRRGTMPIRGEKESGAAETRERPALRHALTITRAMIVTTTGVARHRLKMTRRLIIQGNVRTSGKTSQGKIAVLRRTRSADTMIVGAKPAAMRGNEDRVGDPTGALVVKEPAATEGVVGSIALRATVPTRRKENASVTMLSNDGEKMNFGPGTPTIRRS